jgi:hypothetical protein
MDMALSSELELCNAELTINKNPMVSIPLFENPESASSMVMIFPRTNNKRAENIVISGLKISFAKAIVISITTIAV